MIKGGRAFIPATFSPFRTSSKDKFHFYQLRRRLFSSLSVQSQEPTSGQAADLSFSAKYLIETFGFSPEIALLSSKYLHIRSSEKPDSVVAFLKKHGFNDSQITRVIRNSPTVLTLNPESSLLPKIEFFKALGLSSDETAKTLSSARSLLIRSLDRKIIPSFDFIKNMLKSEKDTMDAIRRCPHLLQLNLPLTVPPNVASLREAGVPEVKILYFFKRYPQCLAVISPDEFRKSVKRIEDLGINPLRTNFVIALFVTRAMTTSNWEKKMEFFKLWGCSESQVVAAFRMYPFVMAISEQKIGKMMDHLINKMHCDPSILRSYPFIISLSLEKTVLPRCAVYKILQDKGLIKKKTSPISLLRCSKKSFLEKFVLGFVKEAPELLKVYPVELNSSTYIQT